MKLTGSTVAAAALGAVGGLLVGLVLAPKPAQASVPPPPAPNTPIPIQDATSTNSLTHGWIYFLKLIDGAGVGAIKVGQAAFAAGFVDPDTKGPPLMLHGPGTFDSLALFTGTTGTPTPQSTPALTWESVLGSPEPEVLTT